MWNVPRVRSRISQDRASAQWLNAADPAQWEDLPDPDQAAWAALLTLPPFTQPPGTTVATRDRITAFLRYLERFYAVKRGAGSAVSLTHPVSRDGRESRF
jgi:hypothetical protein